MPTISFTRHALFTLAFVLVGCSGATQTTRGGGVPTEAPEASGIIRHEFSPIREPARLYNGRPEGEPPRSALFDALLHLTAQAAAAQGQKVPMSDPRLYRVADELARIVPRDRTLPYTPIEFALNHHGVIEPTPVIQVVFAEVSEATDVASHFAPRLSRLLGQGEYTRMGLGLARRDRDQNAIVLVLQKSYIETQPIPRSLSAGESLELKGKILPPFVRPQVVVTGQKGEVTTAQNHGTRSAFSAQVLCTTPGKLQIEVTAESERGPEVLANFPVWCDASPPDSITWEESSINLDLKGQDAEKLLVHLINTTRQQAGLEPLQVDATLVQVARRYSEEMARRDDVAHTLEGMGTVAERAREAGISFTQIAENLARAGHAEDAHRGLLNSPGHRANILLPDVTHVGVGVAHGTGATNTEMFVTQLFIRRPAILSLNEARARVEERLRAQGDLQVSQVLTDIAQKQVAEMTKGLDTAAATQGAVDRLQTSRSPFRRVTAMFTVTGDVEQFDARGVGKRGMTHFGAGIMRGPHPEVGPEATYVLILLAESDR